MSAMAMMKNPALPNLDVTHAQQLDEAQSELGEALLLSLPNFLIAG
jgi:hypothetical protein